MYTCDNWVVIKIGGEDPHYRALVGTSGGYLDGDSWRMNSGIVSVREDDDYYYFAGSSGSEYRCNKGSYGLRMNNAGTWTVLQKQHGDLVSMMDSDTNWFEVDWIIK